MKSRLLAHVVMARKFVPQWRTDSAQGNPPRQLSPVCQYDHNGASPAHSRLTSSKCGGVIDCVVFDQTAATYDTAVASAQYVCYPAYLALGRSQNRAAVVVTSPSPPVSVQGTAGQRYVPKRTTTGKGTPVQGAQPSGAPNSLHQGRAKIEESLVGTEAFDAYVQTLRRLDVMRAEMGQLVVAVPCLSQAKAKRGVCQCPPKIVVLWTLLESLAPIVAKTEQSYHVASLALSCGERSTLSIGEAYSAVLGSADNLGGELLESVLQFLLFLYCFKSYRNGLLLKECQHDGCSAAFNGDATLCGGWKFTKKGKTLRSAKGFCEKHTEEVTAEPSRKGNRSSSASSSAAASSSGAASSSAAASSSGAASSSSSSGGTKASRKPATKRSASRPPPPPPQSGDRPHADPIQRPGKRPASREATRPETNDASSSKRTSSGSGLRDTDDDKMGDG
jgi:hypothetical protein